jgi:hypothetical protein
MMLKVLTHNLAILLLVKELFYRAFLTPFLALAQKPLRFDFSLDIIVEFYGQ